MTDYQLSIGAPKGDSGADVYENFDTFDITRGASSMGSWSATLPFRDTFEDSLLKKIWIYHDEDIIFRGELESFDIDYDNATTSVSGRGILVGMDRVTTSVNYQGTTVYDAIVDFWSQTDWDALVLPPNRDVHDSLQVSEYDHTGIWSWEGSRDGHINQADASLGSNHLSIESTNVTIDETANTDSYYSLYEPSQTDEWWVLVETDTPVTQFDLGMHQQEQWSSEGIHEEVWDSVNHNTPQYFHMFRLQFDSKWDMFRPKLEIYSETFSIVRTEIFIPDSSGFSTIDESEIDGTRFEILQELHDLGSYEFVVDDYDTLDVRSFPVGTLRGEPDWRITSTNRSKDLTDYGNHVTVHGKTLDDGTTYTATASDQTEIDSFGQQVEKFEKNPELTTQAEADSRAEKFLTESINERDESGSIEIIPQEVAPGYTYNVSAWGDAFPYGSQVGSNSLYFRGSDSPSSTPDHVTFDWNSLYAGTAGDYYTWEFLVHPENLADLGDNEYYTLLRHSHSSGDTYIRIYGDGSVEWDDLGVEPSPTRTNPHTVREDQAQRLSIQWSGSTGARRLYVDGQLEFSGTGSNALIYMDEGTFYLGADDAGANPYKGGIDDVQLWAEDSFKTQTWIRNHTDADLVNTTVNIDGCPVYLRFDAHTDTNVVVNDGAAMNFNSSLNGPQYQSAFGQIEEVQYTLGNGDTLSLDFDISGRIDTELVSTQKSARVNRRTL